MKGCDHGGTNRHFTWALLLLAVALPALGHETRPAYLQITEAHPGQFEVRWKLPVTGGRPVPLDVVLPTNCQRSGATLPEHTRAAVIERWQVACGLDTGEIRIAGLSATLTDVLVRITYLEDRTVSRLLRPDYPVLELSGATQAAGAYFLLGVEHLLLGIDHILFVVGLVLFVRQPWMLVKTVTAFTVAHSVTLAVSVLGLMTLPQGPVEAVIALSILFLARELMVPESRRSRLTLAAPWLMAFAFGLLHGFGFAGVLAEIGLPREQLAAALALFNVGIEAGQLGIVAALLGAAWLARRATGIPLPLAERAFTTAMGCIAGFWTIDRVLALAA